MQKRLRLSLAATHALLCAQILNFTLPLSLSTSLNHHLALLSPWLFALGIPLLLTCTKPKVPGQYDIMLAWAAGAIFIGVWQNCGVFGGWMEGKDGGFEGRKCANAVGAEMLLGGLSGVMIRRRVW
jgi:hypothetical protein